MKTLPSTYDVIVVGCGLAGLFCSLRLQAGGMNVLLIEQRSVPGGLCGTKLIDGYEFVIACNDFGAGIERELKELKIPFVFQQKNTIIHYKNSIYSIPPNWQTIATLLSQPLSFVKFISKLNQNHPEQINKDYLDSIVNDIIKKKTLNDLLKIPAYMMGVRPQDFLLEAVNYDSFYNYGYFKPHTPDGGPQKLVETLVNYFQARKGTLKLNTCCQQIKNEAGSQTVLTNQGEFNSSYIVSCQPCYDRYPPDTKSGMKLSMFVIAVDKVLPFPKDVHTIIYYPPGISQWFHQLDLGQSVDDFGFHIFKSDLPEKSDHYTMNIYFYLPRGIDEPSPELLQKVQGFIFDKIETLVPGLNQALKYKRFISPKAFTQLHGLSSQVTPAIPLMGFKKPDNYDTHKNIYYIGNSVYPPGDHAGASILSAKLVANLVISRTQTNLKP